MRCWPPRPPKQRSGRSSITFEGCLPIEVLARRGRDTLRFGPMKPVGLRDPRTGKTPWAVVQLRKENLRADSYNLVGFQNHLKFGEQARVLRLIPGLENARFLRYGQIHRNTYICAPACWTRPSPSREMRASASCLPGRFAEWKATPSRLPRDCWREFTRLLARGEEPVPVPRATALGSLVHYITHADAKNFQPANITFDLLEPTRRLDKRAAADSRQEGAAPDRLRAGAGGLRRLVGGDGAPGSGTSSLGSA